MTIEWLDDPEAHDYPAAEAYLSLLFHGDVVDRIVRDLRHAPTTTAKAKDIMRASGLALLPKADPHVKKNTAKVDAGKALSPVLLVRVPGAPLIVADGYHRVCTAYHVDYDADVPLRISQP